MTTTSSGKEAERIAASWLIEHGYKVHAFNWRTRWCEIDIVAQKNTTIYFVEVRYRKSNIWGDGVDSITSKKYQQMEFSANFWMAQNDWRHDAAIVVIAMSGSPPCVDAFIEA